MIGFPLAPAKSVPPGAANKFLGVLTDFSRMWEHGEISMFVSQEWRQKLVDEMKQVKERGTLTQAEAASLCGKLGFVAMWTWG
eukprot:1117466-Pleurochrysis_carterae.AAC.1